MVGYEELARPRGAWPWWRWGLTALSALALALSTYLAWHYLVGGSVIGCGGSGTLGCNQLLSSRWSTVAGVLPVSGLAMGAYLAMLVASFSIGPATAASVRRLAWGAMLVLVGAAAGSAVWFIIVQKWLIGAFCIYCTATHVTGLLLAGLVIWQAFRQLDDDSADPALANAASTPPVRGAVPVKDVPRATPRRLLGLMPAMPLTLLGLAFAGILAACQVGYTPPAVYLSGDSEQELPTLDPQSVPLVGSPAASYVVKLLFDYECPHCQQMHFLLDEVVRHYRGKLAFALCPAPLNTQCNPYIPKDAEQFPDSCELAKVGLAVWLAKREAFPAFDHWMFSFESGDRWRPRNLDAAKAKAVELVGQAKFNAAWTDPWIARYLNTSIRVYADTIQSGNTAIPKLVFGSRWVIPEPHDARDLVLILQNSLAVPPP